MIMFNPASNAAATALAAAVAAPPAGNNSANAGQGYNSNQALVQAAAPTHHEFLEAAMCFCHRFLNPFASGGALALATTTNGSNSQCLVNPCLLHYCRVCNIQLNSCRQAKIHSEGKKHEKRLSYLKFCLESTDSSTNGAINSNPAPAQPSTTSHQPQSGTSPTMAANNTAAAASAAVYYGQQNLQQMTPQINYQSATAAYYYQPPASSTTGYIYTSYPDYSTPPPQVPPSVAAGVPTSSGGGATAVMMVPTTTQPPQLEYQVQTSSATSTSSSVPQPLQTQLGVMSPSLTSGFSGSGDCKSTETSSILSAASYSSGALNNNYSYDYYKSSNKYNHHYYGHGSHNNHHHQHHGAINNNYTTWNYNNMYTANAIANNGGGNGGSGHGGHGGHHHQQGGKSDGNPGNPGNPSNPGNSGTNNSNTSKSSLASSSSTTVTVAGPKNSASEAAISSSGAGVVFCETCQIAFPSVAVLENHLKGSRHARRVKSQQAFRQLKDAGTLFRIRGSSATVTDIGMSSGAIRCEVCQVSVNSSHQLQAHLTGHKHRVRAIRRGVKTNQAVLSPSSSLLTSSASVSEMSYQSNGTSRSSNNNNNGNKGKKLAAASNATAVAASNGANEGNKKMKKNIVEDSKRERRSSAKIQQQQQQQQKSRQQPLALSRHRSSGCLQSRHCHSTLSLSRARSSSALNRVQSRSMNLLMIQNNNNNNKNSVKVKKNAGKKNNNVSSNGLKTTSSDVLSMASSSSNRSDLDDEDDDEEDEGVATDATTDNGKTKEVIKASSNGKQRSKIRARINKEDGLVQEMAWMRLSNGEGPRTKLKTRKEDSEHANNRRSDIIPNGTSHHEKKIFKRGFNVNAQEWKPNSRRTSVGNASVKDIPMLDVFLQRLDRHSYNSDQSSPPRSGGGSVVGGTTAAVNGNE